MTQKTILLIGLGLLAIFAGCSKSEPNNAMTRYGQNLADDEKKAQDATSKANAAIAQEQKAANQSANQSEQSK